MTHDASAEQWVHTMTAHLAQLKVLELGGQNGLDVFGINGKHQVATKVA